MLFKNELCLSGMFAHYDVHGKTFDKLPFPVKRMLRNGKMAVYKLFGNIGEYGIADHYTLNHVDVVNIFNIE